MAAVSRAGHPWHCLTIWAEAVRSGVTPSQEMLEAALAAAVAARSTLLAADALSEAVDAVPLDNGEPAGSGQASEPSQPRWALAISPQAWTSLIATAAAANDVAAAVRWSADRLAGRPPRGYGSSRAEAIMAGKIVAGDEVALLAAGDTPSARPATWWGPAWAAAAPLEEDAGDDEAGGEGGEGEGEGEGEGKGEEEEEASGAAAAPERRRSSGPAGQQGRKAALGLETSLFTAVLQAAAREAGRIRREEEAAAAADDEGTGGALSSSRQGAGRFSSDATQDDDDSSLWADAESVTGGLGLGQGEEEVEEGDADRRGAGRDAGSDADAALDWSGDPAEMGWSSDADPFARLGIEPASDGGYRDVGAVVESDDDSSDGEAAWPAIHSDAGLAAAEAAAAATGRMRVVPPHSAMDHLAVMLSESVSPAAYGVVAETLLGSAASHELSAASVGAAATAMAHAGRAEEACDAVEELLGDSLKPEHVHAAAAGLVRGGAASVALGWLERLAEAALQASDGHVSRDGGQHEAAATARGLVGLAEALGTRGRADGALRALDLGLRLQQQSGGKQQYVTLDLAHAVLESAAESGRADVAARATGAMKDLGLVPTPRTVAILMRARQAATAAARKAAREAAAEAAVASDNEDSDAHADLGAVSPGRAGAAVRSGAASSKAGGSAGGPASPSPAGTSPSSPRRVGPLLGEAVPAPAASAKPLWPWLVREDEQMRLAPRAAVELAIEEYMGSSKRVRLPGVGEASTSASAPASAAETEAWCAGEASALASAEARQEAQGDWPAVLAALRSAAHVVLSRPRAPRMAATATVEDALAAATEHTMDVALAAAGCTDPSDLPWFVLQSAALAQATLAAMPSSHLRSLLKRRGLPRAPTRRDAVDALLMDAQHPVPGGAEAWARADLATELATAQAAVGLLSDASGAAAAPGSLVAPGPPGATTACRALAQGGWRLWQGTLPTARAAVTALSVPESRAVVKEALQVAALAEGSDPANVAWPPPLLRHRQASAVAGGALHSQAFRGALLHAWDLDRA
ncbi:hypothetical protein FNF31_03215 [Cafeteria roenbergensis]|uniref:Uncharacterized protein n=1 Tax=Cafeteria roenbergensis TaxID=33653 RepID=A0A5A8DAN5_CAFRO|nr:hypothetical protein FNF31_03215 [Cafeteria roenbergensis]